MQMATSLQERLKAFTVAQVAKRLQVETGTVRRLIERGELRARKIGRAWRVPANALGNYLNGTLDNDDSLTAEDLAAIRRGLSDIRARRVVSWEHVKGENRL